jgi:hypothetical protein
MGLKKQHQLGVNLLKELDLTHVRLKRRKDGSFAYFGWTTPLVDGNGTPKVLRRGTVRVKPVR